ncbi:MAG: DEAD/DEAH box helicase family protein [Pyrinomonadaceae bacterium]
MVDFKKRLAKKEITTPLNPSEIYETLDRASDKGPLRPVQAAVLEDWHENYRNNRDVVLKLHTGQGKTLIGLLILQSKLNEGTTPSVYLCPNNYLINQTGKQAQQFGIDFCTIEDDFPQEFIDGKSILITSVQRLFNGLTKFKTGQQSLSVATIVMDDAHACVDAIRDSLLIRVAKDEQAYSEIRDLFSLSLQNQGMGTYADISNKNQDALLPVPYWDWQDKQAELVQTLANHSGSKSMKFAWPLLKDMLQECQCVISGTSLEIAPYLPPLHLFGSYDRAKHRVFMSATVTNDSFLVRGLGLSPETITNPLIFKDENWSGEKMILIPSLIDDSLDRSTIVSRFSKPQEKRKFGVVALVTSFRNTEDWKAYGATIATKETINEEIEKLIEGNAERTLVIVNRYDGIDLPDNACRILVFDSKPHSESLIDRYAEGCRASSEVTAIRTARTIEQGLGRSVRGEKDYCVIVLTGPELIRSIRTKESRKHLSNQTRKQIEIGLEIAEMARDDIEKGIEPYEALRGLVNQSLRRDEGWKAFYIEQMDTVSSDPIKGAALKVFEKELEAERKYQRGDVDGAIQVLQKLIDDTGLDDWDKGWYMQEMARYMYGQQKTESNTLQVAAHRKNRFLMKPRTGMQVNKISIISQKRMENIISWVQSFESYSELSVTLEDILSSLQFGVKADRFEVAFNDLAKALGFAGQRPDKEWKEGPDNLWALRDDEFLLVECKSEVSLTRAEINKDETDQMNRSCAWFERHYPGSQATKVLVIPTRKLSNSSALSDANVQIMDRRGLEKLVLNVRRFFTEFKSKDFKDLSERNVQELINNHKLSVDALVSEYTKAFRPYRH